jgi:plastocyanin
MTQYNAPRRRLIGFCAAILLVGSGVAGIAGAQPSRAQISAGAMATMPLSRPSTTHLAAGSTITRLHQKVVRVTISNFAFHPAKLVVSPGTKIIWTNKDSDPHTVDSTKNVWTSEALDTDGQFARTFKKAGTFAYYCSIHPFMHGTIVVKK